jgi:hypothetical protein
MFDRYDITDERDIQIAGQSWHGTWKGKRK